MHYPPSHHRRLLLRTLLLAPALGLSRQASAAAHEHEHHHHHLAEASAEHVQRSEAQYRIPALSLVRQDGVAEAFPQALDGANPVFLNFIFTSCTTICPTISQVFASFQKQLAAEKGRATLVSISIDPEYDTPARLREYASQFGAGRDWRFYTGTHAASVAIQRAFDAYRGDKMNHAPLTFVRGAPGRAWVRLDGFASPEALMQEYRRLGKSA